MMSDLIDPKRMMFLSFAVFLIGTVIHCILMDTAVIDEVQKDYFPVAEAMLTGHTPYHHYNDLAWEYPPLALVVMFIPRLFAPTPYGYQISFDILMMLFAFLEAYLVYLAVRKNEKAIIISIINLVLMTVMIINGSILERFDIVPAVICLASIILYRNERYTWAFLLVGVGTLVKIYPALLFLAFIIPFLSRKEWKPAVRFTAVTAAVGLAVMLVFCIICSGEVLNFVTYHSDRGLQIESFIGSLINILGITGITELETFITFGSCNIGGTLPDAISPFVMPLLAVMVLLVCYLQFRKGRDDRDVVIFSFLYLAAFMIFNKVFSGQYVMWAVPIFVLLLATLEWDDDSWIMSGILISVSVITSLIMSLQLFRMEPGPMILLLLRNILFVALSVIVSKRMLVHIDKNNSSVVVEEK